MIGGHGLLQDVNAIITGAASGIGLASAEAFAGEGAELIVLADLDGGEAERQAERIASAHLCRCLAFPCDVSDEGSVLALFEYYDSLGAPLDALVNSAGVCRPVPIEELTVAQWDKTMAVNLRGTFLVSRQAVSRMSGRGGSIVNLASQAGRIGGLITGPDYPASKAGVICLTKSLAKQSAGKGVRVNSVAPGLIHTKMTADFHYSSRDIPLGRVGTPEEVADAIVFLASSLSRYMTGACVDVNGGMTMY